MSSDPEEENPPPLLPPATQTPTITYTLPKPPSLIDKEDSFMDLDLDFDSSWLVDQNLFLPNPSSPLLLSILASSPTTHQNQIQNQIQNQNHLILNSSDQPTSPLWFFSDGNDEKFGGNATNSSISESFRLSDCPKLISKNESVTGNGISDEVKRRSLPPTMGLVPLDNLPSRWMIKEKMTQALRHFKESTEQTVLAQVWAPIKNGDRYVLTTSGQPFVLDPRSNGLLQYRTVSLTYMFSVDGKSNGNQGLPGRVFWQKLPEWTPDVQYYSREEYPRLNHALNYNVRGTLALPVFEPSGQSCVGVVELIMTSQRVNYATEVDKVCKALEAVNLKSSEILSNPNLQICNEGRQHALAEILEVLNVVCELHTLPFAQTWVPCMHRSVLANGGGVKKSCSSFDGSCMGQVCMSTTDVAFYIVDAHMWGFRDACAEHHLQKGQGVAGRAFLSHSSYFSKDITEFCKTDYPLVHYALMFGLKSCFAICLRSIHTGIDDYILEFFLPPSITSDDEQRDLVASLMVTMKQHFRSLRVASEQDFEDEKAAVEISKQEMLDSRLESCKISSPGTYNLPNGGQVKQSVSCNQKLKGEFDVPKKEEINVNLDKNQASASLPDNKGKKTTERRRGKTEKTISLEVLQQYFAGSLKDAAKSLGVCPTTMKRICRQHGISRWPSRKINKVNRSLSKLKLVIESVEGAEGSFNLTSLSTSPLSVAVGSISWPVCLDGGPKEQHSPSTNSEFQNQKEMEATHQIPNGHIEAVNQIYEGETSLPHRKASHEQNGFLKKRPNGFRMTTGSADDSTGNPNFHGSEVPMGGMLIEDAGSSKDLSNLCDLETDGYLDERVTDCNWISARTLEQAHQLRFTTRTTPHITATQDVRNMTIKVAYRDDIIRFRLLLTSGMTELKEEVAKRLKLEVGTFVIKYLDDNQEWVVLSCDSDLQECMQIARLSGRHLFRLLVHDVLANLGSSYESTGE